MKMNPVYRREVMVSARSFRLALVLLIFNGILAMVALLNMYSTLAQVRLTAEIQYTSFMELYLFVAVLEFVMVLLITPALTAGSISGEMERRTLELMLTTKLTPARIVMGKLMAALSTIGLMVISSFPIFSLVFVYGGVTLKDLGMLFLCYTVAALFVGSLGICCSAVFGRSTLSTVVSYVLVGSVVIGTYGIDWLAAYITRTGTDAWLASAGAGGMSSGSLPRLLLINPAATFLMTMQRLTGQTAAGTAAEAFSGNYNLQQLAVGWIGKSIVLQIMAASVFIYIAVRVLMPVKKKRTRTMY